MLAASVPLVRDGGVLGVLTIMRSDRARAFTELERDALAMLGAQSALAVANVFLHADVAELALRDPLTGLFNRRYLDPAMEQLFARRARVSVEERVPIAAIMFDLDHFSELNNLHGHQVGDCVPMHRDPQPLTGLDAPQQGRRVVAQHPLGDLRSHRATV